MLEPRVGEEGWRVVCRRVGIQVEGEGGEEYRRDTVKGRRRVGIEG